MPTASEFRQAANILRGDMEVAQAVERAMRRLATVDGTGVTAGPYLDTTIRGVMAGAINAGTVSTTSFEAAAEFDRRAEVCDRYSAAMVEYRLRRDNWQQKLDTYWRNRNAGEYAYWPGTGPNEPAKEASWVEEE